MIKNLDDLRVRLKAYSSVGEQNERQFKSLGRQKKGPKNHNLNLN